LSFQQAGRLEFFSAFDKKQKTLKESCSGGEEVFDKMINEIAAEALKKTEIRYIANEVGCGELLSLALYHTILSFGPFLSNISDSDLKRISSVSRMIDWPWPNGNVIEETVQHQLYQIIDTKSKERREEKIEETIQAYIKERGIKYEDLSENEIKKLEEKAHKEYAEDLKDYVYHLTKNPPYEILDYADEIASQANKYMEEAFYHSFAKIANKISRMDKKCTEKLKDLMLKYLSKQGVSLTSHQRLQLMSEDPKSGILPGVLISEFTDTPPDIDEHLAAEVDKCFL
jgi:hypothetical protein